MPIVPVRMRQEMLDKIDRAVSFMGKNFTRSDFIRIACNEQFKRYSKYRKKK